MDDYINRTALLKRIATQKCDVRTSTCQDCDIKSFCVYGVVETFAAADVALVRHGHWEKVDSYGVYECSCCHTEVITKDPDCSWYCPNCGAKMDGGASHE